MHYVVRALDKADSVALRMANREAHLAFIASGPFTLHVAGPLLDDDGQMCGSLLIFEADDEALLRDWLKDDPYRTAGLFERVEIHAFKWAIGKPGAR